MSPITTIISMAKHAVSVFFNRNTPLYVKTILGAGFLYIISPYDFLSDWLPVIGVMDDIALAALLLSWASRFQGNDSPPK